MVRHVGKVPGVREFALHRSPSGYFYVTGTRENGEPLTTSGIYTHALGQLNLGTWAEHVRDAIADELKR